MLCCSDERYIMGWPSCIDLLFAASPEPVDLKLGRKHQCDF